MGKTNLEYSSLHKKYWDRKIFNRGIVQEIQNEQKHLQSVSIRANELHYFNKITNKNKIAQYTVLTAIYTFLIKRLIFDFDGYIVTNISEKNNSLLLSYPFDLKISFKEYLQKVKGEILETLTYSDFSSDAINEKYAVDNFRLLSHYAINVNSGAVIPCNGISFNVKINENEDIDIQVSYLDGFVNKPIVEFLVHNFTRFIANLESNLEFDLSEYPIISEIERRQLLVDFNKTTVEYPRDKTIIDLFEEQVEKIPNDIAVVFEDTELTYKELNEKSNQLASYLRDNYSLKADDLAGIKLERSERMIVAILGILKSGAAYVPIDVNYPEERIAYIEQDSNSKLIVDEELLEVFAKVQNSYSKDNLKLISTPNDLAYVIYTSGTTGNPKGVMIEHGNLVNSTMSRVELYQFQKVLLTSTIAFDPSVAVIWGGLLSGGTLVIANESIIKDSEKITEVIIKNSVTDILCVPSYYDFLYSELIKNRDSLRLKNFILGGEKIKLDFITTYNENLRNIGLYNEYGPTECTVWSTVCKLDDSLSCIPIGKPISNTKVYILDESLQPLPIGAIGKLYISGAGVARGYLNKPELTKEKFISNPFIEGLKMYDTGDLGKWLPDGNIEFMGRKDHQVKIRGFRIELGEIENVILQYSDNLKQVVVEAKEANGEKSLVAYFTSAKIIDKSELRNFLLGKLPDYMVPGFYVELDELPLTPNGKIDRKALPGVDGEDLIRNEYVAPRSKEEKLLVSVLEDVLKRDSISIKDNFYNLGGDSIKSIQIVSRLKQHGYTLKIQHILQVPVLEQLTKYLEVSVRTIDQSIVTGAVDFTPVQRYFFEDPIFKVHHHFNQSVVLKSKEALSHNFLAKSIAALMEQHDVLRMVYKKQEGNWMQFNQDLSSSDTPVAFYDLREEENGLEVMADLGAKLQSGFDLEAGPLLKVGHFRLKDGDRLALIIHHLVVDGVSWRILLEDLSTLYAQCAAGENLKLPLKTDSFQRWASLQKEYAYGDNQKSEKPYWENICSESVPAFPMDMEKQESSIKMDSSVSFSLDESITELLQTQVHGAYNTEINDVLLTGLGLAIKDTFGLDKSVVRMEGHGREDIIADVDISRTVGWFTSAYPFVLNLADSKSAITSLIEVKEDLRRIPNKGIGYGIQKYLSDGFNDVPQNSIEFNYLGDFGYNVSNKSDSFFEYSSENIGSSVASEIESDAILSISGMLVSGQLTLSIRFSKELHHLKTIENFADSYQKNLVALITELSVIKENQLTPSDLTFKGLGIDDLARINKDNTLEDVYKLSPLQQGIYYHWLSDKSTSMYFVLMSYRVKSSDLDVQSIHESYDKLVSRHGVLRTSFTYDLNDQPLQIVRKTVPSNFSYKKMPEGIEAHDYVEEVKLKDREKGFDLEAPSQMRLQVLDLGDEQYEFIWSFHHILADGWCMSVLIKDYNQILNAVHQKSPLNLPKPLPYSNYIKWLDKVNTNDSIAYWKGYLEGYSHVAEVPFKIVSDEDIYVESKESVTIDGDLYANLNKLCGQIGVTQNTFIQAVWGYLLSRYNNIQDVVFGSVVSGRPGDLEGVEEMIGLFINTIPVRVRYDDGATPLDLLRQIQEEAISNKAHHYLNLSEVQSRSEVGMNLIDHIMVFENYPVQNMIKEDMENLGQQGQELIMESIEAFEQTNYDFNITMLPSSSSLIVEFKYNSNKYDVQRIKNITNHVFNLVEQFIDNKANPLNTLTYLTEQEKHQLLVEFNDTESDYSRDKTVVDLFEEQVERTPNNIAVVFEGTELTYKELNEKSNQLARYLRETYAIEPDDLVGLEIERSDMFIVSLLGILKSGAAYVPIDNNYPVARKEYLKKDSNYKLVVNEEEYHKFINHDTIYSTLNIDKINDNSNLAYVIYTSGSTGLPKGIMMEHQSIKNLIVFHNDQFSVGEIRNVLQFTSISFDVSFQEIFTTLTIGATLFPISETEKKDIDKLEYFIKSNKIETVFLPTAYFKMLIENRLFLDIIIKCLKNIIVAGEQLVLNQDIIDIIKKSDFKLHNHYGPAETHVVSTCVLKSETKIISMIPHIGKPISNTQIYILDESLQPLPIGAAGKVYVSGAGVARGYLNRPELTAEKFISNPFLEGYRMYDTGDLGRWLTDGNIEYMGRKDHQVKIRGFRIELGEIESVISQFSEDLQQVVVEAKETNGEKSLVAYFTSNEGIDKSELRSFLQGKLPDYMVPSFYVELDELLLTPNGKIDRKALPGVDGEDLIRNEYVAPRNETEEKLVAIWQEVLGVERVGVTDNFFELGGHSLSAVRLINLIHKKFDIKITINEIFKNLILENQAIIIENIQIAISNDIELNNIDVEVFSL